MALTDTAIRNATAGTKDFKLADGKGLYLLVTTGGSKLWRFKYRVNGKEKKLSLGAYPEVSLKDARAARDRARTVAQAGSDPAAAIGRNGWKWRNGGQTIWIRCGLALQLCDSR